MRCKVCDYSLKNLSSHRCPECGRAFDPDDPETFDSAKLEKQRYIVAPVWVLILLAAAAATFIMYSVDSDLPVPEQIWAALNGGSIGVLTNLLIQRWKAGHTSARTD